MSFAMYVETKTVNISISNQTQRLCVFFFFKERRSLLLLDVIQLLFSIP